MVLALGGEAVGAIQVAGVGDVQAQGLDDSGGPGLQLPCHGGKGIRSEQLPRALQGGDVIVALFQFTFLDLRVLGGDLRHSLFAGVVLVKADEVVGRLVHHMHRPGAHIQDDVVAV